MKKIYVVFVLLFLVFSSGCITDVATRKEGEKEEALSMQDLFNQSLKDRGLGEITDLHIDDREVDIKEETTLGGGRIEKTEILTGSKACTNFEIKIIYHGEKIHNFNIKTWELDNCHIQGN